MLEELRLPLEKPIFDESDEKSKNEKEKKERVVVLEISPKDHNAIDL